MCRFDLRLAIIILSLISTSMFKILFERWEDPEEFSSSSEDPNNSFGDSFPLSMSKLIVGGGLDNGMGIGDDARVETSQLTPSSFMVLLICRLDF